MQAADISLFPGTAVPSADHRGVDDGVRRDDRGDVPHDAHHGAPRDAYHGDFHDVHRQIVL